MKNVNIRVRDVDFGKYKTYNKNCFCYKDICGDSILQKKRLFSVADIVGSKKFSNLYLELIRTEYGGTACWLWNDLNCITVRVCYIYPCYSVKSNLREAFRNPVARIKAGKSRRYFF